MYNPESAHSPEVGFNLASALPRVLIPGQVEAITEKLADDGYTFASALPLRNIVNKEGEVTGCKLPIWFLEDAWNPTRGKGMAGLMEVVRGAATRDPHAPKIHDFVAFPHKDEADDELKKMVRKLRLDGNPPTVVVHHLTGIEEIKWALSSGTDIIDTIIEINPGMMGNYQEILTTNQLLEELSQPASSRISGVVIDTSHVRRDPRLDEEATMLSLPDSPTRRSLGTWENTIHQFVSHARLVDFQGMSPEELLQTIQGKNTQLNEVMRLIKDGGYRGPVRVEFNLGLAKQIKPGVVEEVAKDVYAYLHETLSQ